MSFHLERATFDPFVWCDGAGMVRFYGQRSTTGRHRERVWPALTRYKRHRRKAAEWSSPQHTRTNLFVYGNMDLDAPDLLLAVDAAVKATRRRATGSTIDDYGARFRGITAGEPPGTAPGLSNRRQRPSRVQRADSP